VRFPYTVSFTPEQHAVLQAIITAENGPSFSELADTAIGQYLEAAYPGTIWPKAARVRRPNKGGKSTGTYGVVFTAEQDEVLRAITSRKNVRFSEIVERSFDDYVPITYGFPWPAAPRLSKVG
jgi:hypothetical protein